jgi:peptidylprolyl isomerase
MYNIQERQMTFLRSIAVIGILALALSSCYSKRSDTPVVKNEKLNNNLVCDTSPVPANDNIVYLFVKSGCVAIELLPDLAPNHVKRIKQLVGKGFYDGIVFHRVIGGFMAQTGDPTGTGTGGSDLPDLKAEFSKEQFKRGVLGMARSQKLDSANSQFFIMFAPGDFLNGQYTVFGKVIGGMENVDKIKKGDSANNGTVKDPDKIIKMQIATN